MSIYSQDRADKSLDILRKHAAPWWQTIWPHPAEIHFIADLAKDDQLWKEFDFSGGDALILLHNETQNGIHLAARVRYGYTEDNQKKGIDPSLRFTVPGNYNQKIRTEYDRLLAAYTNNYYLPNYYHYTILLDKKPYDQYLIPLRKLLQTTHHGELIWDGPKPNKDGSTAVYAPKNRIKKHATITHQWPGAL